jgi:hypothetical protein
MSFYVLCDNMVAQWVGVEPHTSTDMQTFDWLILEECIYTRVDPKNILHFYID